jgi:hypothetical protein
VLILVSNASTHLKAFSNQRHVRVFFIQSAKNEERLIVIDNSFGPAVLGENE